MKIQIRLETIRRDVLGTASYDSLAGLGCVCGLDAPGEEPTICKKFHRGDHHGECDGCGHGRECHENHEGGRPVDVHE